MGNDAARWKHSDVNGLAVHVAGEGEPVLLMPYSHAFTTTPIAEGPLGVMLLSLGRRVVTFDPPGAYASTREPAMTVDEMVGCGLEALDEAGVREPADVMGHSTGGLCAAALAVAHGPRVRRLALLSPTGVGDPSKLRALPFGLTDRRFWSFYRHALPVYSGRGTVAGLKRVYDLLVPALHADPARCPEMELDPARAAEPAPPRSAMLRGVPDLKGGALSSVAAPTLVAVGSRDPIVPVDLARRVTTWMPDARLVVFDGCGHYPQHESPEALTRAVREFLN